jgi:hypothetical protein
MRATRETVTNRSAAPYVDCPRCGASITPRARWLTIKHCPRCLARARIAVRLFRSPLAATELYDTGSAPLADGRRGAERAGSGSR